MELLTPRLRLLSLTLDHLETYRADPSALEAQLGIRISRDIATERLLRAVSRKIEKMRRVDPADHDWYTYWLMILRETGLGAGLAGFKGTPNADGWVEIGYGIDPSVQGRGYTTEACRALIDWAFRHSECRSVGAPGVLKSNTASQRVLEKLGMRRFREGEDVMDWVLERENQPV